MSIDARGRNAARAAQARAAEVPDAVDYGAFLKHAAAVRRRRRAVVVSLALAALLAVIVPLSDVYRDSVGRISPAERGGKGVQTPTPGPRAPDDQDLRVPGQRGPEAGRRVGSGGVPGDAKPSAGVENSVAAGAARILFRSSWDGDSTDDVIYVMNEDGSNRKQLAVGIHPDWSPDGRRVAFTRLPADCIDDVTGGFCEEIWVMNSDGSGQRRLGPGRAPDWSPDGSRISFTKPLTQGAHHWDSYVHIMRADGSHVRALPRGGTVRSAGDVPRWSPNGKELAFLTELGDDGCTKIRIIKIDDSGERFVDNPGCYVESPAWSPDGRQIAFSSSRGENSLDIGIYVARVDGPSGRTPVTRLSPRWDGDMPRSSLWPSWSSDGRRIAYTFDPDGDQGFYAFGYCRRETHGSELAACSAAGPLPAEIHVMNADGSASKRLTEGRYPDFSP